MSIPELKHVPEPAQRITIFIRDGLVWMAPALQVAI